MTDSLGTSSSPLTSNNDSKNDHSSNVGMKREASEEFGENDDTKIRRTSVGQPDDLTSTTIEAKLDATSITPSNDESNNNTATTTTNHNKSDRDDNSSNNNQGDINATAMAAFEDSLLRGQNNGAATAAAISSFLTSQQQQQFLQTYAQASGLDLAQLTASSLAQAMVSPISVPGFNLLQQLQAGGVITALPGPPSEFGLGGHNRWTLQHSPSTNTSNDTNDNRRTSTSDVSASGSIDSNDTTTIAPKDMTGLPPSSSASETSSPAMAAAAAAAAAAARTMSNDERRQRRLLRNRVAAKECRKKKKQYIQDMELKIRRLEEQNTTLRQQLDDINNKLAFTTMQGSESYRLMKEVEELNAKLGIGHLSTTPDTSGSVTTIKEETEAMPVSLLSTSTDISAATAVISAVVSAQQQHSESSSSILASTSASALSTSKSSSLSTPIPTGIPTSLDTSSTICAPIATTSTNQPTKSSPVPLPSISTASSVSLPPPPSSPKTSTKKLEPLDHSSSSSSSPSSSNILIPIESAVKNEEINVE